MLYTRTHGRLRLDDALKQIEEDPQAMEGWSKARIRAFKMIQEKPNAYYYRFNAPGEKQKNGAFSHVKFPSLSTKLNIEFISNFLCFTGREAAFFSKN